jgi:hypothetical protein
LEKLQIFNAARAELFNPVVLVEEPGSVTVLSVEDRKRKEESCDPGDYFVHEKFKS